MKPKHRRLIYILIALAGLSGAGYLISIALRENLQYFFTPGDLVAANIRPGEIIRLGGMVEQGSIKRDPSSVVIRFRITDFTSGVDVEYSGLLPDLFAENQGTIATGKFGANGVFYAETILAKHDETYMPPEVAASMNKQKKKGQNE